MLNERIKNGQENHQVMSCGKPGLFCACKAWAGLQNRPSVCGFLFISLKIYGKIKIRSNADIPAMLKHL